MLRKKVRGVMLGWAVRHVDGALAPPALDRAQTCTPPLTAGALTFLWQGGPNGTVHISSDDVPVMELVTKQWNFGKWKLNRII